MAFSFKWPEFSPELVTKAKEELTKALNAGDRHPSIADDIIVHDVHFGSRAPELVILEICDVSESRFRGIFKLSYNGDAYIVLHTKAQANPINPTRPRSAITKHGILAASKRLVVPLEIKISALRLHGIATLEVTRTKGITLAFKNDPLKSVTVNTTFDDQPSVRRHLQAVIEEQLRCLVNHTLPRLVHILSLGDKGKDAEPPGEWEPERTPYATPTTSPPPSRRPLSGHGAFSLHSATDSLIKTIVSDMIEEDERVVAVEACNHLTAHMGTLTAVRRTISPYAGLAPHVKHRGSGSVISDAPLMRSPRGSVQGVGGLSLGSPVSPTITKPEGLVGSLQATTLRDAAFRNGLSTGPMIPTDGGSASSPKTHLSPSPSSSSVSVPLFKSSSLSSLSDSRLLHGEGLRAVVASRVPRSSIGVHTHNSIDQDAYVDILENLRENSSAELD